MLFTVPAILMSIYLLMKKIMLSHPTRINALLCIVTVTLVVNMIVDFFQKLFLQ